MIVDTLAQLEGWYNEPSTRLERPKLLSKLALIELCGWLETEQDRILRSVSSACLNESIWIEKEVIEKTFGFDYTKHFRPMLARLFGEHLTRSLEASIEAKSASDIDLLRSFSSDLWAKRCNFAHEDVHSNILKQQSFDAPSWSQNRQRVIGKILLRLEAEALTLAARL